MYNENDKIKMKAFIQRLINNPSLITEPKLTIEDNIIQFFIQNANALKMTFSTPNFFPNLPWNDVQFLFEAVLTEEIDQYIIPSLDNMIQRKINFQFMNILLNRQLPTNNFQNDATAIINKLAKRFEIRRNLESLIKVVDFNLIDKYVNQIFEKRSYIARELTIVEKIKLNPQMTSQLIKTIILLGMIGYIRADLENTPLLQKLDAKKVMQGNPYAQKNYYEKIMRQYLTNSTFVVDDLLNRSISFHINFTDDKTIHATSRLARIFNLFGKNYRPNQRQDKGADTYEKSWFQAQRKNYKFFGLDGDMIDELYRISAENYW